MAWAPCFYLGQYPGSPAWWWELLVKDCLRPFLQALAAHPHVRTTLAVHASSTEQLYEHGYQSVLEEIADAQMRGQIEFAETTYIPLVLPLIPWDCSARYIKKNHEVNAKYFGASYAPTGFFLPYGAYSRNVAEFIASLGYRWLLLDGISFPQTSSRGSIMLKGVPHLRCIMRNREATLALIGAGNTRPSAHTKDMLAQSPWCVTSTDIGFFGLYRPLTNIFSSLFAVRSVAMSGISELPLDHGEEAEPMPSSVLSHEADLKAKVPFRIFNDPENHFHGLLGAFFTRVQELWAKACREKLLSTELREKYDRIMYHDSALWASGSPWWSFTMVNKGIQALMEMVRALPLLSEGTRGEVQVLYERSMLAASGNARIGVVSRTPKRYGSEPGDIWDRMAKDAMHTWAAGEGYHGALLWNVFRERIVLCKNDADRMAIIDELCVAFRALPHLPLCG